MYISVIVPVFNDWRLIGNLYEAMSKQTLDRNNWELIIIDNDPSHFDDHKYYPEVVDKALNCQARGSYAARNVGIRSAKGDLLAFTDADCIPSPNWLEEAYKLFESSGLYRIAGEIRIVNLGVDEMAYTYESCFAFPQKSYARHGLSVTGNMFARKYIFDVVGEFDERMMSGGDFDWARRAISHGFGISYCNKVIVQHPARSQLEIIAKSCRVVGGSKNNITIRIKKLIKLILSPILIFKPIFKAKGIAFDMKLKVYIFGLKVKAITFIEWTCLLFGKASNRE